PSIVTSHDPIDLALGSVLAACHRIQFRLRHNHFLIRPAHADELANEWHLQFAVHFLVLFLVRMLRKPTRKRIDKREVAVHVFIFDECATHDDLRNQNQRYNIGGRLRIRNDGGNHQTEGDPTHRRHEHDPEVNPKHPADFENVIADQDKEDALHRSEEHTSELQSLAYLVCRLLLEK